MSLYDKENNSSESCFGACFFLGHNRSQFILIDIYLYICLFYVSIFVLIVFAYNYAIELAEH